jgi:23S rRNA (uracil1939-C5)-methyltransferase
MPIEITIEKLIYGGDGLARHEGKSVFVPFTIPGERVSAKIVEDRRSFARAEVFKVLEPAPERVPAPCPYFGSCGGCHYQHVSYEAQLRYKSEILVETLKRSAGVVLEAPLQVIASSEPFGYRNRTRVHLQHAPQFRLGYYRSGSHQLLAITQCPISSPLLNRALRALWSAGEAGALPPAVSEVEIFAEEQDAECLLELYIGGRRPSEDELARFASTIEQELPECVGIHVFAQATTARGGAPILQTVASAGEASLDYQVDSLTYRISAGGFFQINRYLLNELVGLVTDGASGRRALDLYAGAGLFSAPLARSFEEVIAVESSPFSFADLETNLPDGKRYAQTTESFLQHRAGEARDCDLAIIDPPRAGLGEKTAQLLALAAPREIRYVSCDPATLARDLRVLLECGYRIEEAHLVDMFPQTLHLESFVRLSRRQR